VFHEIGLNVGQGLINGVNTMGGAVNTAITTLVNGGTGYGTSLAGAGTRAGIVINNTFQGNQLMSDKDMDDFARKISVWQRRQVDLQVTH
jgi:hypothetical protein